MRTPSLPFFKPARRNLNPEAAALRQIDSIPKIDDDGSLNYSFAVFIISYFVVVNWSLLQVIRCKPQASAPVSSARFFLLR